MKEHTDYGTRLKRFRRERRYTAAELADSINDLAGGAITSRDAITRVENHIRRHVPLAEATLAAQVLCIPPVKLLFTGDDPRAKTPFFEYQGMTNRQARDTWRNKDADKPLRVGGKRRSRYANHDVIRQDPKDHTMLAKYASVEDAVRWLRENGAPKASHSNITDVCRGRRATAYGYSWVYWSEPTREVKFDEQS